MCQAYIRDWEHIDERIDEQANHGHSLYKTYNLFYCRITINSILSMGESRIKR